MEHNRISFNINWTKILFCLLLLTVVITASIFYSPIFSYLLISIVVAYILDPIVTWLEYKRIPRWFSIILVYLVIGGIIAWLTASYVPWLINQGNALVYDLSTTDKPVNEAVLELPVIRSIHEFAVNLDKSLPQLALSVQFENIIENARVGLSELPKVLLKNYQSILSTLALLFTIPIFSFFLLKDRRILRRAAVSLLPNRIFELGLIILNKIDETVGRYLRAILLEMISVSIMASIALSIVGVPYSILIGIIAGITNVIPYIGPWIGGGLAVLAILITGNEPIIILWVGFAMFLVQSLDNYIVYPIVVGNTIKMHPLVVLLTVFAGGYFGGVIWMLISVPLVFMVYSLMRALYINLKQFRLL